MSWPIRMNLVAAVFAAALVWLWTKDQPDLGARVLLVLALFLISRDPLDAAAVALEHTQGLARLVDPKLWVFLWLNAASTAALISIFMWGGGSLDLRVLGLGALLGLFIGASQMMMPSSASLGARFNTDRPADASLLGRVVFFGWPIVATAMVVGVTLDPPDGGWNGVYPLFQIVFLAFLMVYYPTKGGFIKNWPDHMPRVFGFILLIASLIWS